jgi:aldose 1-epimerase
VLWADRGFPWLLLYSGDGLLPGERRRGLAVEPMTCPPDALRSGEDVITLQPGETTTARWGIDVTGFRD